jgi:exportin-1
MMQHARLQISGIKKYIVGLIIKTSSDSSTLEAEKVYLNKLNMILVQASTNHNTKKYQC